MEKTTEERLADIESGISRLTKMQGCMFNVLLILDKATSLSDRAERAVSSFEIPLSSVTDIANTSVVFMFGAFTMIGLSFALSSLYLTTQELAFRILAIVTGIVALALGIFAIFGHRTAKSQIKELKKKSTQTKEDYESFKKEAKALDAELAQALAEWKELFPDDLASEPKSKD